jgi:hypothetical protein
VPAPAPNSPPAISGVPPATASVGTPYVFVPTASDPDNDRLTFSIARMPSWMSFNTTTGQLFGNPANAAVGSYANIEISVTDGVAIAALPPFSIAVASANAPSTGSARLQWVAPTQTNEGTPLVGLAGFRVYYGLRQSQPDHVLEVTGATATEVTINGLGKGTWYFAVSAYTETGAESVRSNVVQKSI